MRDQDFDGLVERPDWRQQQEADERQRWEFCQSVLARYESVMFAAIKTELLPLAHALVVSDKERKEFRVALGLDLPETTPKAATDSPESGKPT